MIKRRVSFGQWNKPLLILTVLTLVLFWHRQVFTYHFDPAYWENFYYESQWNIPNSKREISDQGVYRYVGYRLVNGENPFNVDYWVPPFGKYLYGLTAKYFSNPYLTSVILYLLSIIVLYFLSKELLSPNLTTLAVVLYILNPLLLSQLSSTMLDLPLSLLFLCYLLGFVKYLKHSTNHKYLLIAMIFLGLAAGTKAPFYPLVIFSLSTTTLIFLRKPKLIPAILAAMFLGYVFAYFSYFIRHPNPIPWLRLHQKVIEFQSGMRGTEFPLNTLQAIFLASTRHYDGRNYPFGEWYLLFPLFVLSLFKIFFRKTSLVEKLLIFFCLVYLAASPLLDFWPRYFVPILAPLTLIFVSTAKNRPFLFLAVLYSIYLLILRPILPLQ